MDWNLAQLLYAQGVRYAEIAERIDVTPATLRQHARRHAWRQKRDQALAAMSHAVTKTLRERARDTRALVAEELERQAHLLTMSPPKCLAELANRRGQEGRASVVKAIASTASTVFGQAAAANIISEGDLDDIGDAGVIEPAQAAALPAPTLREPD